MVQTYSLVVAGFLPDSKGRARYKIGSPCAAPVTYNLKWCKFVLQKFLQSEHRARTLPETLGEFALFFFGPAFVG